MPRRRAAEKREVLPDAKFGDVVLTKGDKMPEPSAAQKKKNAEIRAQRAKQDGRDATEKASSGRYSDRYSELRLVKVVTNTLSSRSVHIRICSIK